MINVKLLITALIALCFNFSNSQNILDDRDKKPAIVFVENGNQDVASGRIYASSARGASRNGNGNSNGAFGNIGDWSVDFVVSEKSPSQAASDFIGPSHNGMGATGWGSFAAGAYNRASGAGAVAIGFHNAAGPLDSDESSIPTSGNTTNLGQFAVGYGTQATGHVAFSAGQGTTASGDFSTAMGSNTNASGDYSVAIGNNLNATEIYSVAIGTLNTSSGYASTTLGDSNWASGRASTAIGAGTIAEDYAMLSIGTWSLPLESPNPSQFSNSNTAFLIGNGINADSRSNAVQILFDGTTTIAGDLNVNSDARLKANIISLGSTLAKVLQIDGKSYTMKKDENKKQKIGVLAQDIEKVFPELVSESNGVKSVNYQGLVPVLINALKEQDEKISRLENLVEKLISEK